MEAAFTKGHQMNDANYLAVTRVRVDSLRPSRTQAHGKVTDHRVQFIAKSLKTFGQFLPILITPDSEVIAGHNRLNAAKKAGWEHINAIVITSDPNAVFVSEHSWEMRQENWAQSVERGLPVELVRERQPVTADNIQKSAKLFGDIGLPNSLGYPPSAWKVVMRVHNALNARLDPEDVPTVRSLAKWVIAHDMLKVCVKILEGRKFPAKLLLSAMKRDKPLTA